MCLVALAIDPQERFPLVVASNRDEYFDRPAAPLAWWRRTPGETPILSGRDLLSGGTWLGLSTAGRLALLTNLRGAVPVDTEAPSRGAIVPAWLAGREPADQFWMRCALSGHNGFNLVAADFSSAECFWASNQGAHPKRLAKGVYGLSNAGLDTPWPKVLTLKARLREALTVAVSAESLAQRLFDALADRAVAPDADLPATGVPIDWERRLSAAFIASPERRYGTRCSTVVITERTEGTTATHLWERSFDADGTVLATRRSSLRGWPNPQHGGGADACIRDAPVTEA